VTRSDTAGLVFGVVASALLAGTLVVAGLKAGITPGVSPLVVLFAWGAFVRAAAGPSGTRFLNLAQVAGSAGPAVTAGVIFTAPVVQILYRDKGLVPPPVDVFTLFVLSLAGALIGFGFVGLATRQFLADPTLPAPEARACETMIAVAVAEPERRPRLGRSLVAGLVASFAAPLLVRTGLAREDVPLLRLGGQDVAGLPFAPIYLGIGGLLTLSTALLVFGGSFLHLAGDVALASLGPAGAPWLPANTMRWVGGGAMTVCVAYSLLRFWRKAPEVPRGRGGADDPALLEVDAGRRTALRASILAGTAILLAWVVARDGPGPFAFAMAGAVLVMCMLMVALGALLSLQIGSSASPVSGTIFVTTLVLATVALAAGRRRLDDVLLLTPLLVGACVAVCAANDSSQDYKTLQLCGLRVQDGFLAQFLGLIAGCIVVPLVLAVVHEAYTLGSDDLTAPQGKMFATLLDGLLLERTLPWAPILAGVALGALAVAGEMAAARRGLALPSMALAVGIYLPSQLGLGMLIGALCRRVAEGPGGRQRDESVLAAAGLITGAAMLELLLGVGILFGLDPEALRLVHELPAAPAGTVGVSSWVPPAVGVAGLAALGGILFVNSRRAP
jgi:uncharacterized oligopeptide transporter (OPT) family protein